MVQRLARGRWLLPLAFLLGFSSAQHSMKGYELYSWRWQDTWHYALLVGTNRLKTTQEIHAASRPLGSLEAALRRLPPGEEVFWLSPTGFSLPPGHVMKRLTQLAAGQKLVFHLP